MRTLSLETTYGALCISTRFAWRDDWETPTMLLQIGNDMDGRIRIHFTDPDALDQLAAAVRGLQQDCRTYRKRLAGLHIAS